MRILIVAASPNKAAASGLCTGPLFVAWLIHSLLRLLRLLLSEAIKASLYQRKVVQMISCRGFRRLLHDSVSHLSLTLSPAMGATLRPGFSDKA